MRDFLLEIAPKESLAKKNVIKLYAKNRTVFFINPHHTDNNSNEAKIFKVNIWNKITISKAF